MSNPYKRTRMKAIRIERGDITQAEAAARIGVRKRYYELVERGEIDGSVNFWIAYRSAFRLSESEVWQIMENLPTAETNFELR